MNLKPIANTGRLLGTAIATALAFSAPPALAANYALIMGIGDYSDRDARLPGINLDVQNAQKIAETIGVPRQNQTVVTDGQLSLAGMRQALDSLAQKVRNGDNVFIYYSGHGTQVSADGGKCSEGLVTYDMDTYYDRDLKNVLAELSSKAGQLVFMNDSCFSGGAADFKSLPGRGERKAKAWKIQKAAGGYQCGRAINMKLTRDLVPEANRKGANMLYIAAAQDNEVADATPLGSAATLAWMDCLNARNDQNNSGTLTGAEMRSCGQRYLDRNGYNHHISLDGNENLSVAFLDNLGGGLYAGGGQAVSPAAALEDLKNRASAEYVVQLTLDKPSLRIGVDELGFRVNTNRDGYLTILQVGTSGRNVDVLFPNAIDQNNRVNAGTVTLPRPSWRVRAGGPTGTGYLLAIVTEVPRDFTRTLAQVGGSPFFSGPATAQLTKDLTVSATGANTGNPGRFGASLVVPVREVQ